MLRIAIAEDSPGDMQKIRDYLSRYQRENGEEIQITEFSTGTALVERYRPCYDLILLDVEMPGMDGISVARELRTLDANVLLMFITNMAQYAVNGYEVDALDYVLKPVGYYAFALKLKKVRRILRERSGGSLMLPFEGTLRMIPIRAVLYVEVRDHKLFYHTYEGESVVTGNLKTLEEALSGERFARCNNCYLVNLIHVRCVTPETVWVENHELKISRPRRKAFMQALSDYYGGGGR